MTKAHAHYAPIITSAISLYDDSNMHNFLEQQTDVLGVQSFGLHKLPKNFAIPI